MNCLHLCDLCIDKAFNTVSYKVPSPDGKNEYQLHLLKNNLRTSGGDNVEEEYSEKDSLLEDIDSFRDR